MPAVEHCPNVTNRFSSEINKRNVRHAYGKNKFDV